MDAIEPALDRVRALGGTVTMGRTEVQGQGRYAVVEDSGGTEIALRESPPR